MQQVERDSGKPDDSDDDFDVDSGVDNNERQERLVLKLRGETV